MVSPRDGWFAGIPLPEASLERFTEIVAAAARIPGVRRMQDPATAHLTLRYFGTLEALEQDMLRSFLNDVAPTRSPLSLVPSGWETFGPSDDPQVLVLRIASSPELTSLADQIRALPIGQSDLLPFRPHITIARFFRNAHAADAVRAYTASTPPPASLGLGTLLSAYAAPDRQHTQVVQHTVRLGSA